MTTKMSPELKRMLRRTNTTRICSNTTVGGGVPGLRIVGPYDFPGIADWLIESNPNLLLNTKYGPALWLFSEERGTGRTFFGGGWTLLPKQCKRVEAAARNVGGVGGKNTKLVAPLPKKYRAGQFPDGFCASGELPFCHFCQHNEKKIQENARDKKRRIS